MKTKALFTAILLTVSLNSSANFIYNKIPENNDYQSLQTPYFKNIENLKKDNQDTVREQNNFSNAKNQRILDIRKAKKEFFDKTNWTPPKIATYSYQNFGLWDAAFLWYLLDNYDNKEYALFFHQHRNDPGIELFKKEVRRFSNITPKYRNFLYRIEQKTFLEDPDSDYLPTSINPLIAFSEHKLHYYGHEEDALRINVSSNSDNNTELCEQWENNNYLNFNVICTETTDFDGVINNYLNGETDSIMIQSDEFSQLFEDNPVMQSFQGVIIGENYLFMLVPKGSNVFQLNDLKNTDYTISAFPRKLTETLKILGDKNPEFKEVFQNAKEAPSSSHDSPFMTKYLRKSQKDILMISCKINDCPILDLINSEYHKDYEMIPINFWQLLNEKDAMGNRIYTQSVIPYKYPNIQNPDIYQKHDIKHIGLYNYLIISDYWFEYHKEHIRELEAFLKNL